MNMNVNKCKYTYDDDCTCNGCIIGYSYPLGKGRLGIGKPIREPYKIRKAKQYEYDMKQYLNKLTYIVLELIYVQGAIENLKITPFEAIKLIDFKKKHSPKWRGFE
jgi:hypothetical protein